MSALATHGSRATQHLGFEPRAGVSPACNAAECSDAAPRSNPPTETAIQPAAGQATARSANAYGLFSASPPGLGTSVAARCSSESCACTSCGLELGLLGQSAGANGSLRSGLPVQRGEASRATCPGRIAATGRACRSRRSSYGGDALGLSMHAERNCSELNAGAAALMWTSAAIIAFERRVESQEQRHA